jgi:hypothetical protein
MPRLDITEEEIGILLKAMDDVKLINWYSNGDESKKFIEISAFDDHQTGLHKRTASRFPDPAKCVENQEIPTRPGNSRKFPEIPPEENRIEQNRTEQEKEKESPSDFDLEIAGVFKNRASKHFKTVTADLPLFAKSVMQMRTLDKISETDIRKIAGYLAERPGTPKGKFCWFDQIGTPSKLREKTKDGQFRIWEKILQEIKARPKSERELIEGGF